MAKFLKKVFWFAVISTAGYFAVKFYQRIKEVLKLSETLPEYINNIYQEKPKLSINLAFKKLIIKLTLKKSTIDEHTDLEETILEYINDYYPALSSCRVEIKLISKEEPLEEKATEDTPPTEQTEFPEDTENEK
ncbi:MAG: hypothetical protein PHR06_10305 [Candidatus Cloacimonetes bacterium]|nr:hypothetical protein [Candidatus Cloacimonadota bacterium]